MPAPAFSLKAPQTGTDYRIFVAPEIGGPLPAILFMDADDQFEPAANAYAVARAAKEVPPLLLVGVGYGASYTKPGNKRVRDYTPSTVATEPESGGADAFVAFLTNTLWPELAQRYSLREDLRGIAGHSLGSLLAVHALFQRQPFFNRLLASAPSLWWDNRAVLCTAQNLQRTGAALPAKLFLSAGTEDTPSMHSDLEQFEDQLRALPFPQLEVISERFPGRDHYNVLPEAFRAGLRALFG
jgi:predicted alpha/beta superfamily hydrolase